MKGTALLLFFPPFAAFGGQKAAVNNFYWSYTIKRPNYVILFYNTHS